MRVSKQAAAENRQRILDAAAEMFREHGIDGAGVDAITEAAGLTHGAFYSQFGSKDASSSVKTSTSPLAARAPAWRALCNPRLGSGT